MVRSPFPATILAMALLACAGGPQQPDPYRAYRQLNPGWSPGVLEVGMPADEALATAFAPMRKRVRSSAKVLGAYGLLAGEWLEDPLPAEPLVAAVDERLVVARLRCIDALVGLRVDTVGWYHFYDGALLGYMHWTFGERCVGRQTIQPSTTQTRFDHLIPEPL